MVLKNLKMIYCQDLDYGIGYKNELPWDIKEDINRFSKLTKRANVIMGKNTYLSIPDSHRPLPDRHTIIISSTIKQNDIDKDMTFINNMRKYPCCSAEIINLNNISGLQTLLNRINLSKDTFYVIGGEQIYNLFFKYIGIVERTVLCNTYITDAKAPLLNHREWKSTYRYRFETEDLKNVERVTVTFETLERK